MEDITITKNAKSRRLLLRRLLYSMEYEETWLWLSISTVTTTTLIELFCRMEVLLSLECQKKKLYENCTGE